MSHPRTLHPLTRAGRCFGRMLVGAVAGLVVVSPVLVVASQQFGLFRLGEPLTSDRRFLGLVGLGSVAFALLAAVAGQVKVDGKAGAILRGVLTGAMMGMVVGYSLGSLLGWIPGAAVSPKMGIPLGMILGGPLGAMLGGLAVWESPSVPVKTPRKRPPTDTGILDRAGVSPGGSMQAEIDPPRRPPLNAPDSSLSRNRLARAIERLFERFHSDHGRTSQEKHP